MGRTSVSTATSVDAALEAENAGVDAGNWTLLGTIPVPKSILESGKRAATPRDPLEHPARYPFPAMQRKNLQDLVSFSEDGANHAEMLSSDLLYSEVISLGQNQETAKMGDGGSDAIFVVVAGEAVIYINRSFKRLRHWDSALAPAGSEVVVKNATGEPAIVLMVAAARTARD